MSKWVSTWGNAMSISEVLPAEYAKDITLRYTIVSMFDGDKIKLSYDNFTGKEPVTISKTTIDLNGTFYDVTFDGNSSVTLDAEGMKQSDPVEMEIHKGDVLLVSFYLGEFTSLRCGVATQGPYSAAQFAWGDETRTHSFPVDTSKKTNWVYFLNQIDIHTSDKNKCVICYGDSITAQDWPDYVQMHILNRNKYTSVIRRAVSGTRVLREYDCITYQSYGLEGAKRFDHEMQAEGATSVVILQGINDIIHPVGTSVNQYRPMSDLPTSEELIQGLQMYIEKAHEKGLKVYLGTLLPIGGWRTYADFREEIRNDVNRWIRKCGETVIDFDKLIRDPQNVHRMLKEYDSGDHLHPSTRGYQKMAQLVYDTIKNDI